MPARLVSGWHGGVPSGEGIAQLQSTFQSGSDQAGAAVLPSLLLDGGVPLCLNALLPTWACGLLLLL